METIRALVQAGADVNASSEWFGTPLCLAAIRSDLAVLDFLIAHKADVNKDCGRLGTVAHAACERGELAVVHALHAAKVSWDVKRSICPISFRILAQMAKEQACLEAYYARSNMGGCYQQSPGAMAVYSSRTDVVDFCLSLSNGLSLGEIWKMPPSQDGGLPKVHSGEVTLLGLAMSNLDIRTGNLLLKKCAQPYAFDSPREPAWNRAKLDALMYALQSAILLPGRGGKILRLLEMCVGRLLDHGVNINSPIKYVNESSGTSDTEHLREGNDSSTTEATMQSMASLPDNHDRLDEGYETPLMYVLRTATDTTKCMICVHVLRSYDASTKIRNHCGESAMDIAEKAFEGEDRAEVLRTLRTPARWV